MEDKLKEILDIFKPFDLCSVAQKQKDPLECQWAKAGSLEYCRVHQGIKTKPYGR